MMDNTRLRCPQSVAAAIVDIKEYPGSFKPLELSADEAGLTTDTEPSIQMAES
jgi:hypothetical protein